MRVDCDLCEAAHITPWFFEDDTCWIAECEVCGVPMVVWKSHGSSPSNEVRAAMLSALERVAEREIGVGAYRIDAVMRQIPDHFHAHARRVSPHFPSLSVGRGPFT